MLVCVHPWLQGLMIFISTRKEEFIWNMIISNSLSCSNFKVVELKVLRLVRVEHGAVQNLDFR